MARRLPCWAHVVCSRPVSLRGLFTAFRCTGRQLARHGCRRGFPPSQECRVWLRRREVGPQRSLGMVQEVSSPYVVVAAAPGRWGRKPKEGDTVRSPVRKPGGGLLPVPPALLLPPSHVHIDLDCGRFPNGWLRVAPSRYRSLAGLSLKRPLQPWDAVLDPEVLEFHECATAGEFMEEVPA